MKTSGAINRDKERRRQEALIALRDAGIKRQRRSSRLVAVVVANLVIVFVMYTYVFVPISLTIASPVVANSNSMPGMYMGPTGGKKKPKALPIPDIAVSVKRLPGGMPALMPGMDMSELVSDEPVQSRPLAPVLGTFGAATTAVMLTAGFQRRQDRAIREAKKATRAARATWT